MKLSVAANWDMELLDGLAGIPEGASIYAKLPFDVVGGGRAGMVLPTVDWDSATAHVHAAQQRGLSFCYLINAPCLGNLEQTREGKEQIRQRMRHYTTEERYLMSRMLKLRCRLLRFDICIDNGALTEFLNGFQKIQLCLLC